MTPDRPWLLKCFETVWDERYHRASQRSITPRRELHRHQCHQGNAQDAESIMPYCWQDDFKQSQVLNVLIWLFFAYFVVSVKAIKQTQVTNKLLKFKDVSWGTQKCKFSVILRWVKGLLKWSHSNQPGGSWLNFCFVSAKAKRAGSEVSASPSALTPTGRHAGTVGFF